MLVRQQDQKETSVFLCASKGCVSYRKSIRRDVLEGDTENPHVIAEYKQRLSELETDKLVLAQKQQNG